MGEAASWILESGISVSHPTDSALRGHVRAERIRLPRACYERSHLWIVAFGARPFAWLAAAFVLASYHAWPAAALCLLLAQRHFQTLVHDASHGFYHRTTRVNDLLANWLAAGWIGMTVQNYRRIHLKHHAHNGSADDPEHVSFRTVAESGGLLKMVLRYACLLEVVRLVRKYYGPAGPGRRPTAQADPEASSRRAHVIGSQLLLAGASFAFEVAAIYPIWLYLAMTWSPLLSRLRFLVEHPGDSDLTVTTRSTLLERPLFAPLNFNLHFEHHAWPGIPPYRLKRAHRYLREFGFYERHPEFANASFIGSLIRRQQAHRTVAEASA
jgi:fatty acid desaturase